jgi:hypothetical protein
MRLQRTLLFTLAALLACAASAQAQIGIYNRPQINPRPTVSPYLNILRGNPAINYFGSVRPQMEVNRQIFQMQQEMQGQASMPMPVDPLAQQLTAQMMLQTASTTGTTGTVTGHPTTFYNYSHYFGNRGGSGAVAGGVGGPTGFGSPGASPIRPYIAASLISNIND